MASAETPRKIEMNITDKNGAPFRVDYYRFPKGVETNSFEQPELAAAKPSFLEMASKAFPNYTESGMQSLINKVTAAKNFDFVYDENGQVVAFHVFRVADVFCRKGDENHPSDEFKKDKDPLKTIYVDHAATDPEFEDQGLTTRARLAVFDLEKPDVFCGSSANGGIYIVNQRIAQAMDFRFYPTAGNIDIVRGSGIGVPPWISYFAEKIHDQMGLNNAELDSKRLVRTYKTPVSQGKRPHPLGDILDLGPTQHVFYMGIRPETTKIMSRYRGYPHSLMGGGEKPWNFYPSAYTNWR